MHIRVNGTDHDVPDACTVADLLREIGLLGDQWRSRWIATWCPMPTTPPSCWSLERWWNASHW